MNIGLLSDTHGWVDPKLYEYFKDCDEIWHAGDFGNETVANALAAFKPVYGVFGNIDGRDIRNRFPLDLHLERGGLSFYLTHIGGYPGRYSAHAKSIIEKHRPDVFICGHSHILKVIKDEKHENMLCLNPGAAGVHGFHKMRTVLRFSIKEGKIKDLEVIELGLRGLIK